MSNERTVKRCTAKRKAAVVMDISRARPRSLRWLASETGFRTRPKDIREQYESQLRETKEALGQAHLQISSSRRQTFLVQCGCSGEELSAAGTIRLQ